MDMDVSQITSFMALEKGRLDKESVEKIYIQPTSKVAVFYFIVKSEGPYVPRPEIKITYPTYNSIHFTNKLCLIECFGGVIAILVWVFYQASLTKNSSNENILTSQ